MKKKEYLVHCLENKYLNNLSVLMLTMLWWINGEMSADDRDIILTLLKYTYNSSTKILTNTEDNTTFTIYQLFLKCCTDIYPIEPLLDKELMKTFCEIAEFNGYITTAEKETLVNLL